MDLYEAWQQRTSEPITRVVCRECKQDAHRWAPKPLGTIHDSPLGPLYAPDEATALKRLEPTARNAHIAQQNQSAAVSKVQPGGMLVVVSLDGHPSKDDPQIPRAWCEKHPARAIRLTVQQLRRAASTNSPELSV